MPRRGTAGLTHLRLLQAATRELRSIPHRHSPLFTLGIEQSRRRSGLYTRGHRWI